MANMMRAMVICAPMEFGIEQVPVPSIQDGGMLLEVKACSLCGSDLRTLRSGHRKVTFPWTLGHEVAGVVQAVGSAYQGPWKVGEMLAVGPVVYCGFCDFCQEGRFELCENSREMGQTWQGGFAEYIAIPEEAVRLGVIRSAPAGMDPVHAAVVEPVSSCVNAQEKGMVGLGDTVVIIGTGPIGCIHTQLAHARGAKKVMIADVSEDRLKLAEAFGPDELINASRVDLVAEVRRLTNGKGADVIVTANPVPSTQVQAVEMAKKGARILLFGGLPVDQSKPGVDMNLIHYNGLHLIGTTTFAPRHFRQALDLVAGGQIHVEKLITRFPLDDFNRGAGLALEGKLLKAVFIP